MDKNNTKVQELITSAMGKIHEMADANAILGEPVKLDGGVTVIPVSKVSYGFAGGGTDLPTKTEKECFGGGSGAGITVSPMGFLVISNGEVQLLQLNLDVSASSAIVNMVPEVFNKVAGLFKKKDKDEKENANGDTDDIEIPADMFIDEDEK
ncbi:MAG: GerW family sporulation protein [Ruminococcus sp.]|nr:GerW family sporulation protein [Ruminococcus sp.]